MANFHIRRRRVRHHTIAAKTNPPEGFVGDVSVTGSPAPEPSTSAMMLLGFGGLALWPIANARNSRAQRVSGSGAGAPYKKGPAPKRISAGQIGALVRDLTRH